jgi:hypothetical protein
MPKDFYWRGREGGGFQCRVEGFWRKRGGPGGWVGFEMFTGKHGYLHYVGWRGRGVTRGFQAW